MNKINYPLVTIMIPTYNQASIVHRAINSALAQDYPNLEVIVADDNSADDTAEVVKKYKRDNRLKYFRNEQNLGRVGNYKKCLEDYATGEWVVNCDGDDYYIDNYFISEVIALIQQQDQNIVFAQGGKIMSFPGKEKLDIPPIDTNYKVIEGKEYFLSRTKESFFSHMVTLYKRELAISIDFYSIDITSADRESFFRLALHGNVLLIKKAYGKWVGHGDNFSLKLDISSIADNYVYITAVSNYAKRYGYSKQMVDSWRRVMTVKYFSDWIVKIGSSNQAINLKLKNTISLIKYLWCYNRKLFKSHIFILAMLKAPVKWISHYK